MSSLFSADGPQWPKPVSCKVLTHELGGKFIRLWFGNDMIEIYPFIPDQVRAFGEKLIQAADQETKSNLNEKPYT
jgi:hypothetical protein